MGAEAAIYVADWFIVKRNAIMESWCLPLEILGGLFSRKKAFHEGTNFFGQIYGGRGGGGCEVMSRGKGDFHKCIFQ